MIETFTNKNDKTIPKDIVIMRKFYNHEKYRYLGTMFGEDGRWYYKEVDCGAFGVSGKLHIETVKIIINGLLFLVKKND